MAVDDGTEEIVQEFLVEAGEHLDRLDRDLAQLEEDPSNREVLASIFRALHTIKGNCGFLGYAKLESVAHVAESLLVRLRDGSLTLTPDIASTLSATTDAVREILASIARTRDEGAGDYSALVERLTALQGSEASSSRASAPSAAVSASTSPAPAGAFLAEVHAAIEAAKSAEAASPGGCAAGATVRVDVGLLDKLLNLVGELVQASNQILEFAAGHADSSFVATTQALNLITTELQEGVIKTRMQPIRTQWDKLPRVVRDLAVACGKRARLDMEGAETELDRMILEAIKDPMTHILRNCIDHGLESPERRVAAGKRAEGSVTLRAYHEAGYVNVEIEDDGGGIDPARVRDKAIERGLVTHEQAAGMSERQLVDLIFLPGFSTAEAVTNVSGRGVGMDVVKTNIEKIGGSIAIRSAVGVGTTQRIRIPITLAVMPALIVTVGSQRCAIPQASFVDALPPGCDLPELPLVPIDATPDAARIERLPADMSIVVLQSDDCRFGLVVGSVDDIEDIVVKPLGKQNASMSTFAGTTLTRDGKIAMILDVAALAQQAGVASEESALAPAQAG